MKRVAIIACDNGLGHVRRCYLVGLELARCGILVDLFAPVKSFEKFKTLFASHENLRKIDFSTGTSAEKLINSDQFSMYWHERLPDISQYHTVVSDNLPEILHIRPDALLSGHFFWHNVLNNLSEEYRLASQALIERCNPIVIATELFASEIVRSCPKYTPVGLYINGNQSLDALNGDALLITGGNTPVLRSGLQKYIQEILRHGSCIFGTVYIDPDLLHSADKGYDGLDEGDAFKDRRYELPDWIKIATYDDAMYKQVAVAICRPGIGTITDLLQHGGRAICVYESGNKEMAENARRLEAMGLGLLVGDFDRLDKLGTEIMNKNGGVNNAFASALCKLNFEGSTKTAQIVMNH